MYAHVCPPSRWTVVRPLMSNPKITIHFLPWKFSAASFQVTVAVDSTGNNILTKGIKSHYFHIDSPMV